MDKILFIGSFLSKTKGTRTISESLGLNLKSEGIDLILSSKCENKVFRIVDIICSIILFKGNKIHVDVFSGPAFMIAEISTYIARLRNKKVLITLHGGKLIEFSQGNIERVSRVLNRASIIHTPSLFLKKYFENEGFEIKYLPNSIDISQFPFNRESVTSHSLLWVRAFSSIYNPKVAIDILNQLYLQCLYFGS